MRYIFTTVFAVLFSTVLQAQTFPAATSFAAAYYGDKQEQPDGMWLLQLYDAKDSAVAQINLIAAERCRLNDTYALDYDKTVAGVKSTAYVVIDKGETILKEGSLTIEWQSTLDGKLTYSITGEIGNGTDTYDVDLTIPCVGSYNACAVDAYNDFGDAGLQMFEYSTTLKSLLDDPKATDIEAPKASTGKTKEYTCSTCDWIDKTTTDSWWQMVGRVDNSSWYFVSISPSSTSVTAGTYQASELEQSASYVAVRDLWDGVNKIYFQSGSVTLTENGSTITAEGLLLGYNGTLYTIHMTADSKAGIDSLSPTLPQRGGNFNGKFLKDGKIVIYKNNIPFSITGTSIH